MSITDRLRFAVIEANTNVVLTRDLIVKEPKVMKALSGPCHIEFKIPQTEMVKSAQGIQWKNYGQWIVCDMEIDNVPRIFCVGMITDNKVDPKSGDMIIEATGFSQYPKGIPWLENFNPIAVDPFEVVQRIWAHCQSFSNANLGIEVGPASSGTQMLPGYSFDGSILIFDFFAIFIRAVDFVDCGDFINGLARDIPFDYFEESTWSADRMEVNKNLRMAYPFGGLKQEHLTFRLGENVTEAEKAEEMDIEPVSDVIIRGWLPGKVYSSSLSNLDETRFRRTVLEEDARIDSTERAAAWAKRKLTRRNVPKYWKTITINPNHPNGPYGKWDVGDSIYVQGEYPWYGQIAEWHRVMSVLYDESTGLMQVECKVEGAFNYDPIEYNPDPDQEPGVDPNLLMNGDFGSNLSGWRRIKGQWFRVSDVTYDGRGGSVRVDHDDNGEAFLSQRVAVLPGQQYKARCVVKWNEVASSGIGPGFILRGFATINGAAAATIDFDSVVHPEGAAGWHILEGTWTCPATGVNELAIQFTVDDAVSGGKSWWTNAKILKV